MKIMAALSVPAMLLGVSVLTVTPAEAHTPNISADCNGVRVAATAYDAGKANRWSVTIGGVTQSGTFGASLDQTFPVPQAGATTTWSAFVEAEDGSYHGQQAGSVARAAPRPRSTCASTCRVTSPPGPSAHLRPTCCAPTPRPSKAAT